MELQIEEGAMLMEVKLFPPPAGSGMSCEKKVIVCRAPGLEAWICFPALALFR